MLEPSDLPAPLSQCPGSGAIANYIAATKSANPDLAQRLTRQWNDLKSLGATEAAINLFAADPSACSSELAAAGKVQSAASLVVAFAEQGQADRAWQAGILGFTPPVPGELPPGARGTSTGLGPSSWTYDRTRFASRAGKRCFRRPGGIPKSGRHGFSRPGRPPSMLD
jgi:hypothetical protein